jgi:hypothetical protein
MVMPEIATRFSPVGMRGERAVYILFPFLPQVGKEKKSMAEFKLPTPRKVGI